LGGTDLAQNRGGWGKKKMEKAIIEISDRTAGGVGERSTPGGGKGGQTQEKRKGGGKKGSYQVMKK